MKKCYSWANACDTQGQQQQQRVSYKHPPMLRQTLYRFRSAQAILKVIVTRCWKSCSAGCLLLALLYWLYGGAAMLSLLTVALLGAFYHYQDSFLYHPETPERSRLFVQTPTTFSLPYENIYLRTEDGVRIHAYFVKQPPGMLQSVPTVLMLHGNAGNIGHRLPNAQALYVECQCNILLLEWRGYGRSDGAASEAGLFLDAKAAMDLLLSRSDIDTRKVIVFGRSLGGAVAIKICSHPAYMDRACAVVVENSFTSIPMLAKVLFHPVVGRLPDWAFRNQFFSVQAIRLMRAPTLFLSGLDDHLVPAWMMEQLFQNCGSPAKHVQRFPNGGHNNTWQSRGYYNTWRAFLSQVALVNSFLIRPHVDYDHQKPEQTREGYEQTEAAPVRCASSAGNCLRSESSSSLHGEPLMDRSLNSSTSSLASLASNGPGHRSHTSPMPSVISAPPRKSSLGSSSNQSQKTRSATAVVNVTASAVASVETPAPLAAQVYQYQSNWDARETSGIVVNECTPDQLGGGNTRQSANLTDVWSV